MGIKYKVDENFFKRWTYENAYILGFIFADGSLENSPYIRGKYLRITNTDLPIISRIKTALKSCHHIGIAPATGNRKEKYSLRIGSKEIYKDLGRIGLRPNKSLNMQFPEIPRRFMGDFIRGYFDGDGTICFEWEKNKSKNRLKVIFTSGSKDFLLRLSEVLQEPCAGYSAKVYDSRRSYQLIYRSRQAVNVLNFMYDRIKPDLSMCIKRKYAKYKDLMLRPRLVGCDNLFDKKSKIWTYGTAGRRTQAAKGGVCKTPMQRFDSARRLHSATPISS